MVVMKIAMGQCNPHVGAIEENAAHFELLIIQAGQAQADLLVFPEMALCGYPPEDLLFHADFHQRIQSALQRLAQVSTVPVLLGAAHAMAGACYNAAFLLHQGQVTCVHHKQGLPNEEVFDEMRYFDAGVQAKPITINDHQLGVMICEDGWSPSVAQQLQVAGAQLLIQLNGSPYAVGRQQTRVQIAQTRVHETQLPLLAVNLFGGQDELLFDGHSFALSAQGDLRFQAPGFVATLDYVHFDKGDIEPASVIPYAGDIAELYQALTMGVRDYVHKSGFSDVIIGLSGGIDSALTLAIAVDALGAEHVEAIMMPSPYTEQMSLEDSQATAQALGVVYHQLPIYDAVSTLEIILTHTFASVPSGLAKENIQARVRGTLLMALSNQFNKLVLTTGNKSEMSVGYCTLYGDMAGAYNVLKDVWKTQVYQLASYRNSRELVIPVRVLTRAPSAELRPDQTDQDSLPPYEILDAILCEVVEHNASAASLISKGYDSSLVTQVIKLLRRSEYKRRQAPPGPRISYRAFGKDWRYPIVNGFKSHV